MSAQGSPPAGGTDPGAAYADSFAAEVQALCRQSVTDAQWSAFLAAATPNPSTPGRAQTLAATKQVTLRRLWNDDSRVAPWAGTA